ncbi:Bug family tripartite tricarboxylate transporter substrate binding protein [Humitalea sp. 24SJ18S-53]|uniref:Bug family tripartite tricarboxylate transporter substrate binding protein n=1 Tax=Humitalea sp. 24SJ18S-53 TaxID=3422307 RepID=UPI003D67DF15
MRWIFCVLLALATPAQAFPDRPVTIVVGFAPGGATDTVARVLAERLAPRLGQPVVVQNVPGAGGTLGADRVAKAPPDGHMLAFVPSAHSVVPGLFARLPFDSVQDFAPVAFVGDSANILVVTPTLAVTDLPGLLTLSRAGGPPLLLGSAGLGGFQAATEMLRIETGMVFERVPYRSGAQAALDVMAGRTQMMFANVVEVSEQVRDGRLRALGATSATRAPLLPQVPSFVELGFRDFQADSWFGLLATRGTPEASLDILHRAVNAVLAEPGAIEAMRRVGVEARAMSRADWAAFLTDQTTRWTAIARASGARAE